MQTCADADADREAKEGETEATTRGGSERSELTGVEKRLHPGGEAGPRGEFQTTTLFYAHKCCDAHIVDRGASQ